MKGKFIRSVAALVLGMSVAYFIGTWLLHLRPFYSYDTDKLIKLSRELKVASYRGEDAAKAAKGLRLIETELFLRRIYSDEVAAVAGLAALIILIVQWLSAGGETKTVLRRKVRAGLFIEEKDPTEEYVNEYELYRRMESGFATKEEAVEWLNDDAVNTCEYCGGRLKPPPGGKRAFVQMITFYREVPEGARDMRVVLGSAWFAFPAPEMVCEVCGRVIKH